MYQALYRKYRPKSFADVYGQDPITETLKNQLISGRIFHAYLFTGSRGTGKTTCAKILAKAACCPNLKDGEPCNECEICRGVDDGSLMDVLEIDAASNNGVDDIRDLREKTVYTPNTAKYRVFIIDEVHMLSGGAFNALLKTLEAPPSYVIFILATTEVHKLPATILSRCQRFDFRRIDPELIAKRLKDVCKQEKLSIADNAAMLIASLADGGMRDALSILDLCAGTKGEITEQVVADICGLAGREYLSALTGHLEQRDAAAALALIAQLHGASVDMTRLCEEMIAQLRNIMLMKTLKDSSGLVVCSSEERAQMTAAAQEWRLEDLMYALSVFEDALSKMGRGSRRTALEMAVIRFCSPELNTGRDAVMARLTALERAVRTGGTMPAGRSEPAVFRQQDKPVRSEQAVETVRKEPSVPQEDTPSWEEPAVPDIILPEIEPAVSENPPAREARRPALDVTVSENIAPQPDSGTRQNGTLPRWSEILGIIAKTCPLMHGVLQGSVAYEKGDLLLIDCENSQFRDLVNSENPLYKDSIRNAAMEVTGKRYRLGPYHKQDRQESDPLEELMHKASELGL